MSVSRVINIFDRAMAIRRMHRDADVCQSSHDPLLAFPVLLAQDPGSGIEQSVGATLQMLSSTRMTPHTVCWLTILCLVPSPPLKERLTDGRNATAL